MSKTELSLFLRASRLEIELNQTLFYERYKKYLGVSLSVFGHYETGERTPKPEYLERIAPILKVHCRSLLHLWARAHMPSPLLREFFDGVPGVSKNVSVRASPDERYRFSRSDKPFLRSYPQLWNICVMFSTHFDGSAFSVSEMAKHLDLKVVETKEHFSALLQLGLILESEKGLFKSNYREFNLPHDDEFTEIRNSNFKNLSGMVLKSYTPEKRALGLAQRFTFTCRPSKANRMIIQSKLTEIEALLSTIKDEGDEVCSLIIGYSDIAKREKSK